MKSKREHEDPEATQIVPSRRLEAVGKESGDSELVSSEPEPVLAAGRRLKVVLYSVALALLSMVGLVLLVAYAWYLAPGELLASLSAELQRYALVNTLFTMMVAGAAGGALANLRQFLQIGRHDDGLPTRMEVPLYLRPLSGAVMAVVVFFVLQFFIAVLSVGATTQGWALLHGRLAYVAVALLVGLMVRDLEKGRDVLAALLAR